MFEVLESVKRVAKGSQWVSIDKVALNRFSHDLVSRDTEIPPWEDQYHFSGTRQETLAYLLVLDSINFCFWPAPGKAKWEIQYRAESLSGYYALAAALKRAAQSGTPITSAQYWADLSLDTLTRILGQKGDLQLLEQRLENLREVGRVLLTHYEGEAYQLVEAAHGSAVELARLVARRFASFRDVAQYKGAPVFFYKRAQILAADLYGAFGGRGWGRFTDMDALTAFADYKLPQVLRHIGVLRYTGDLSERVDRGVLLEPGSPEEVEIRANTLWAVELIRRELRDLGNNLRAFEIDWILWNLGQEERFRAKAYHRTVTIFY
ncbi:MAG: queuosine salvage family protein [Deltaproteobacteria bacterium]|nr:queuosine salvage family protein [Deltaproteobacteria bacterium]